MIQNLASKSFLGSLEASWISGVSRGSGSSQADEHKEDHNLLDCNHQGEPRSMQTNSSGLHSSPALHSSSVLREGCTVRGAFECDGDLVVEGFLEGDLLVGGLLTVTESATVRANVRASSVRVFGRVLGDISAEGKIELHSGSQVRGNIKAKRLLIQDGVVFDGRCTMLEADPAR